MKKVFRIIITLVLALSLTMLVSCKDSKSEDPFEGLPGFGNGGIQGPMVEHNP